MQKSSESLEDLALVIEILLNHSTGLFTGRDYHS